MLEVPHTRVLRQLTDRLSRPPRDMIDWLGLAAAPTFALMAWVSAVGSPGAMICSAASAFLPINDMTLMYLLMSAFHISPWLKVLLARLQRNTSTTQTEGN